MTNMERGVAVSAVLDQSKLGISKGRVVIVAECNAISKVKIWIDAIPMFNEDQTAITIEFQLVVDRGGKPSRTTIENSVVKRALKRQEDVIVASALSQYGWLCKNCPEFDELMASHELKKATKEPKKTSPSKRI